MDTAVLNMRALPDYKLELSFKNGSKALINMSERVENMRFSAIQDSKDFLTATIVGEEVVWTREGSIIVKASVNELLDSMQM